MNLLDMIKPVDEAKENADAKKKVKKVKQSENTEAKPKKFKSPFKIQVYTNDLDISGMFEEDKEYTPEEVSSILLEHKYYMFAGEVEWDYRSDDNVLLPVFKQHKKG